MNNSTVTFTTLAASANPTTQSIGLIDSLQLFTCSFTFLFGIPTHSYVIWLIMRGAGSGLALEVLQLQSVCLWDWNLYLLFLRYNGNLVSNLKIASNFLQGLGVTGRTLFVCLMCVERYLAVVHPVTFLKYKPLRYRVICCTVVWIMTLGSCLFCMFILMARNTIAHAWFLALQLLSTSSSSCFVLWLFSELWSSQGPGERGREREEENNMREEHFISF